MSGASVDEERTRPGLRAALRWLLHWRREPSAGLPARMGRYRVLERLGEGGMGLVHLAEDEDLRRKVALKTLKRRDRGSRRRFLREARAAARVSHPNLCPIFEVGGAGGHPFLAMELLPGETLAARLRRGPLAPAEALDLAEDLLEALAALHQAGVVHRDVKPSNIFLTPRVKLVDFGLAREMPNDLARRVRTTSELTLPGVIVGTPGYMAPEQILGHAVDARADVFSAGAVLYEALAGRAPFAAESVAGALAATLYDEPRPLGDGPQLLCLDAPLRRALAKRPAERFDSAIHAAEALRAATRAVSARSLPRGEVFVGRRAELDWLEARFASALAGAGSVAFVTGERGVGKSSLAGELLRGVRTGTTPVTLVAGRCVETQGPGEAFLPFLDGVGRILTSRGHDQASELLRTYAPTICVQMPAGLLPDPDGALRRQTTGATKERLIREAGDFIEAACRTFPILMLLEDLQWADPASVDLLHHLGCRVARQRMLIVAALRREDMELANPHLKRCVTDLFSRGAASECALQAFAEQDVGAYLEARLPAHRLPAGVAARLYARSEGLPLFVRSLVDLLVARGDVVPHAEGWTLARPVEDLDLAPHKGLQDLVRDHLEGLAPLEREVLEVASVAGREFLSPVIAHVVGRDERRVEEDLRRLCRVRRLIVEGGEETLPDGAHALRYGFAHLLYSEALREDLVASRRHELHRAIAARLRHHWGDEAPRLATEIARHCEEGRDHAGAIAFRGHAGDNAARLFAYAEAEGHYDWAFRWLDKLPAAERAAAALELHRRRGAVRLAQARFDRATEDYETMLTCARATSSPSGEQAALAGLCDALFFAQRLEAMGVRAQQLAEGAGRVGSEAAVAEADARMGQVLVAEGRFGEAVPRLERAIAAARRCGASTALQIALSYRTLVHYFQTEYAAAEARSVEAVTLARERRDGFHALAAWMFTGLARTNLGRMSEALEDFGDATAAARRNDDWYWLPRLLSHVGWVHRELGALELAREHDTEALRVARERPVWGPEAEVLLNLASDEVRQGRVEQAAALLGDLQARARESTLLRWLSELRVAAATAEHWAVRADHDRVAEHAATLAERARRIGARDYACASARFRGAAALARGEGLAGAARDLEAALALLRPTPAPLEAWKSARVLALLKRRLGDEAGARAAYAEAARSVDVIAAGTRDEALRAGFLAMREVREVCEAAKP
jgi:tetratricopeptide (TPR) repeat protein